MLLLLGDPPVTLDVLHLAAPFFQLCTCMANGAQAVAAAAPAHGCQAGACRAAGLQLLQHSFVPTQRIVMSWHRDCYAVLHLHWLPVGRVHNERLRAE
jgi:hypothetical protein